MEKKNTILLTVIAIATLLVAVVGATFAYFASNIDTSEGNVDVNVNTSGKKSSFIAIADGNLNISVEGYMMQQGDADPANQNTSTNTEIAGLLTKNATLNVSLTGTDDDKETTCSYDLVYTWTGNGSFSGEVESAKQTAQNKYTPSEYYIRTQNGVEEGFKEFTVSVDYNDAYVEGAVGDRNFTGEALAETNIDELEVNSGNAKKLYLVKDETITSTSSTKATHVDYRITIKFYNLGVNQDKLIGKNFAGTVGVENVVC